MTLLIQSQAALIQTQAAFYQNQAAFLSRVSETDRLLADLRRQSDDRFSRIEAEIATILRVLEEHSRILAEHSSPLQRLPEAVGEKIGFKAPTQT
jgi:hypothetical protein